MDRGAVYPHRSQDESSHGSGRIYEYRAGSLPLQKKLKIIQRRPNYYIIVILIPTYLIVSIALIGMFTPGGIFGEREEKVCC